MHNAHQVCLDFLLQSAPNLSSPRTTNASVFARLFWLVAVAGSMLAAISTMFFAYNFNQSHRTLLAVDTTHYPLWRVHVPAVTVCPSNKVLRTRAARIVSAMCVDRPYHCLLASLLATKLAFHFECHNMALQVACQYLAVWPTV